MIVTPAFQFCLDPSTGVPVYRQMIDQVLLAIASGVLKGGDQLPTVRQVSVDLAINPNTVLRAYRELEIRGTLTTQQGLGTYVTRQVVLEDQAQRQQRLNRLAANCVSRAGAEGFTAAELGALIIEMDREQDRRQ